MKKINKDCVVLESSSDIRSWAENNGLDPFSTNYNLDSAIEYLEGSYDVEFEELSVSDFCVSKPRNLTLKEVLNCGDVSAWKDWDFGELTELSAQEYFAEISKARNIFWSTEGREHLHDTVPAELFPPIILAKGEDGSPIDVADGRGRLSFAIGNGWKKIPAIVIRLLPRKEKDMSKNITIPADLRSPVNFNASRFKPNKGSDFGFGYKKHAYLTPNSWHSAEAPYAARLFVGFSVESVPTYDMDDLIKIVKSVRKRQIGAPDSSFVYQKGVFTHGHGLEVTEDAAQVVILNLPPHNRPRPEFESHMIELAETIREVMEQETVIVEIQKGGVVLTTYGIDAQGGL